MGCTVLENKMKSVMGHESKIVIARGFCRGMCVSEAHAIFIERPAARWRRGRGDIEALTSGKASLKRDCEIFQEWLRSANACLCASAELTDPVVISSESMNDNRPVKL
jgi:hypothetical protein